MENRAKWDIPQKSKAIIVLQQHVFTGALEQGDVGSLFDFEMLLLPAEKQ